MTDYVYQQISEGDFYPMVDLKLAYRWKVQPVKALVDTGAEVSVFKIGIAESLGIPLLDRNRVGLNGVGGDIYGYYQTVTFRLAGKLFKAPVIFAENSAPYNLLGRKGIFHRFLVTFNDYERKFSFVSR